MTTTKWISSLAVATAISLVSFASGAAETADRQAPTRTVRAWDLDRTNPQDVQTLYERVQDAATQVCRHEAQNHWRVTRRSAPIGWTESCVTAAVDKAVRNTGDPVLAALHIRTGVARTD
jgi:UrcA family protein